MALKTNNFDAADNSADDADLIYKCLLCGIIGIQHEITQNEVRMLDRPTPSSRRQTAAYAEMRLLKFTEMTR